MLPSDYAQCNTLKIKSERRNNVKAYIWCFNGTELVKTTHWDKSHLLNTFFSKIMLNSLLVIFFKNKIIIECINFSYNEYLLKKVKSY